jgi:hypothetical protein
MKPGVKSPPALILINIQAQRSGSFGMRVPLTFASINGRTQNQGAGKSNETKHALDSWLNKLREK